MEDNFNESYLHNYEVDDESQYIKSQIQKYTFIDIAKVVTVTGNTLTCAIDNMLLTNVEILVPGVKGFGIKFNPAIGDIVLLLCPKHPVKDIKSMTELHNMPMYDISGTKCIPLTDTTTAQLITVSRDSIEMKVNGISTNKNEFKLSSSGMKFKDTIGNTVETSSSGIVCTAKQGGKIEIGKTVKINGHLEIK